MRVKRRKGWSTHRGLVLKVDGFNWTVPLKNPGDGLHSCPRRNICQEECSVSGFEGLFCSYIVRFEEELMTMLVISSELEHQHSEALVLCPCHPDLLQHSEMKQGCLQQSHAVMIALQFQGCVQESMCNKELQCNHCTVYKTFPRVIHID